MDDRRFDALTRSLAHARNRRHILTGLLGLAGGAIGGSALEVDAARRPDPTPKPASCPGMQYWDGDACVCPDGFDACGPDCCPADAQCCDNACCYGMCLGEEQCCPWEQWCDSTGECCSEGTLCCGVFGCAPPGQHECCIDTDCGPGMVCDPQTATCQCVPNCDGSHCGSDGCGNTCECPPEHLCDGEQVCHACTGCVDDGHPYESCGNRCEMFCVNGELICLFGAPALRRCQSTANCPENWYCVETCFGFNCLPLCELGDASFAPSSQLSAFEAPLMSPIELT